VRVRAMILQNVGGPLVEARLPDPTPGRGQVAIAVDACAVCRTDLHILDGELAAPRLPLVLGHQIVGRVAACGPGASRYYLGSRVGVPWLGWTCGVCTYCRSGRENLCDEARFTGLHLDGGYAELAVADERYCSPISDYPDHQAAPLLCGGLIGYRALCLAGDGRDLGFYGFGSAAHQLIQVARFQDRRVHVFTRPGDTQAASSEQLPPRPLDAAIIFAPVGALVPAALRAVRKGGVVVCAGIHMSDIPGFPYADLWNERIIRSVANLTRADAEGFLDLAPRVPVRTTVRVLPLDQANEALALLRSGQVTGSVVLSTHTRS
jgi:propanol-preferring alcohol dehydrogenase